MKKSIDIILITTIIGSNSISLTICGEKTIKELRKI